MKQILIAALLLAATQLNAQNWKLSAETGMTLARLIPTGVSSPQQGTLKYSYGRPGAYVMPELQLQLSDNIDAGFSYQYSGYKLGTTHRLPGTRTNTFDEINMHSLALGISMHRQVGSRVSLGAYVKTGFAHTGISGMGGSGSSGGPPDGHSPAGGTASGISRTDDFSIVKGLWIPTTTMGFRIAPVKKGWAADRLSINWSATVGWKNIYDRAANYDYFIESGSKTESGTINYEGMPFVMQMGIHFRMFEFGGRKKE